MATLRLMTLNIAHGRGLSFYQGFHTSGGIRKNLSRIAQLIESAQPDIVALQEVDAASHWNHKIPLLDLIRRETGFPFYHVGVHNNRTGTKPLAYGNALLSRFPLEQVETHPFGRKSLGEKGFLAALVELPGRPLPLINLHLDYKSRQTRRDQANRILRFIEYKAFAELPILCGDFNARKNADKDAVAHLVEQLRPAGNYQVFPDGAKTWPAFLPALGLDFVFLPPYCEVREARVLPALVSDHRPVQVEFSLQDS